MTQIIFHIAAIACIVYTFLPFRIVHSQKNAQEQKHRKARPRSSARNFRQSGTGYLGRHRLYICLKGCHQHVFNSNR